jgi:type I pantothenate kinase
MELDRSSWAALAGSAELPLDADDLARLRTLGDEVGLDEVRDVYLPLSQLLSMHVRHSAELHRSTEEFLAGRSRSARRS